MCFRTPRTPEDFPLQAFLSSSKYGQRRRWTAAYNAVSKEAERRRLRALKSAVYWIVIGDIRRYYPATITLFCLHPEVVNKSLVELTIRQLCCRDAEEDKKTDGERRDAGGHVDEFRVEQSEALPTRQTSGAGRSHQRRCSSVAFQLNN